MRGYNNDLTPGQRVAYYRRRRGLSQTVLAGLVGRTESWVEKIEAGRMSLDVLSNIAALARALDVSTMDLLPDDVLDVDPSTRGRSVPALRNLVLSYRFVNPRVAGQTTRPTSLATLKSSVAEVFDAYQSGRFSYAVARLEQTLPTAWASLSAAPADRSAEFRIQLAYLYQAAASVLTKVGELDLAMLCADRGETAVDDVDDAAVRLSLQRSIAHALLANSQYGDALAVVDHGVSSMTPRRSDPRELSVLGTMHLVGAMACARNGDRREAQQHLAAAETAAELLGGDANHLWTAFGPTNVSIHRVAVAGELGDYLAAAEHGPAVNVSGMPIERQVRHQLEVARALHYRGNRDDALRMVLRAEHVAPEHVRRHFLTHALVQDWLRSRRLGRSGDLHDLARRTGALR